MFDTGGGGTPGITPARDTRAPRDAHPWVQVRPPLSVLVDLRALNPLPPLHVASAVSDGLQLRRIVPGTLTMWARALEGDWWGHVAFQVEWRGLYLSQVRAEQWVPAHVIRRAR